MKKLTSIAAYALMAPAITLGFGSALATDSYADNKDAKEQRTTQEQRQMPKRAQNEKGMETADRAQEQRMAAERTKQHQKVHGTYLSSAPANSFNSDKLIGAELQSRSNDETVGEISDLVIGEDGHIAAVIVEVGGFLGLGEKEVAVSWDAIERRSNEDGDGYYYSVDTTKDALNNAPEYKTEDDKY